MIDQRKLQADAAAWIGTPFFIGAQLRGVAVDCVRLAAALLEPQGVLAPGDAWPAYTAHGEHLTASILRQWFEARPDRWELLPATVAAQPGDVVLIRVGKFEHHAGVVIAPPVFVHALKAPGVIEGQLNDTTWTKKDRIGGFARPRFQEGGAIPISDENVEPLVKREFVIPAHLLP